MRGSEQMAQKNTPRPQQGGSGEKPAQQQDQSAPAAPQQGAPVIRDWASI
jgi:hypothetical protein